MTLKIEDSELGVIELDFSWWYTHHTQPNAGWHIRFTGTGKTKFGPVAENGVGFLSYKALLYRFGRDMLGLDLAAEQCIMVAEKHLKNIAKLQVIGSGGFGDGN